MSQTMKTHTFIHTLNSLLGTMPKGPALDPFTGPNVARITAPSHIAYVGDDGDPDDGGDDGEPATPGKTFTQAEVDKIVQRRVKKMESALTKAEQRAAKAEENHATMQARLDELDDKLNAANKSDEAKELAKLQRKYTKLEDDFKKAITERDEAVAAATEAKTGLSAHKTNAMLTDALLGAGAYKKGVKRAVASMKADGIIEETEDGALVFNVGGVPYDDAVEAAKKWLALEGNEMFAEGMPRGPNHPRGGNLLTDKQLDGMRPGSLIQHGLGTPPSK